MITKPALGTLARNRSRGPRPPTRSSAPTAEPPIALPRSRKFGLAAGVGIAEPGANLIRVGVVQVVKDGQGLLPTLTGGRKAAAGVLRVADVDQDKGLIVPVTDLARQSQGVLIAGDGGGIAAEVMVSVGKAVPGHGRTEIVTQLTVQTESLTAPDEGLLIIPLPGVLPADRVESLSLPGSVIRGAEQGQSFLNVAERIPVATLAVKQPAQGVVGSSLAGAVVELAPHAQ